MHDSRIKHIACLQGRAVRGRALVIADGATSKLATHLGYCTEPPKGVCSRAYVEGGTHNTKFDGIGSCLTAIPPLHEIQKWVVSLWRKDLQPAQSS